MIPCTPCCCGALAYPRYAPDPVLNRGVALESLRRFEEAAADYEAVLAFNPYDPAAWNNLGNVMVRTVLYCSKLY